MAADRKRPNVQTGAARRRKRPVGCKSHEPMLPNRPTAQRGGGSLHRLRPRLHINKNPDPMKLKRSSWCLRSL